MLNAIHKTIRAVALVALVLPLARANAQSNASQSAKSQPIRLHPANPHYFLFRGKPIALITSGEHYGAVLNRDFDYRRYLDALQAEGLNYTRLFGGSYVEVPAKSFGILHNDLAPEPGRFLAPWARSDAPGYAGGGNKFDLEKWEQPLARSPIPARSMQSILMGSVQLTLRSNFRRETTHWSG